MLKSKYNLDDNISYDDTKKFISKMSDNEIIYIIDNLYIKYSGDTSSHKISIANKGIVYPNKIWRFYKNKTSITHFNKNKELLYQKN